MVITTGQLLSSKPQHRFCAGSNLIRLCVRDLQLWSITLFIGQPFRKIKLSSTLICLKRTFKTYFHDLQKLLTHLLLFSFKQKKQTQNYKLILASLFQCFSELGKICIKFAKFSTKIEL